MPPHNIETDRTPNLQLITLLLAAFEVAWLQKVPVFPSVDRYPFALVSGRGIV